MTQPQADMAPWEKLEELLDAGDAEAVIASYHASSPHELARAVSRLDEEKQALLLMLLGPETAADFVEELEPVFGADLLEELSPESAAAIVDEMASDEQADVLGELDDDDAEAILAKMDPDEAQDARELAAYPSDTAGGLMVYEYLAYPENMLVTSVLDDLRRNAEDYREYDVQYLYITEPATGRLRGLGRIKDLVLSPGDVPIGSILAIESRSVPVTAELDELEQFFDRYDFHAAPVVDDSGRLLGAVRRAFVEEAVGDRAEESLMRIGGIVTGEELRTMPMPIRAARRLAFLIPTLLLALLAISVIAFFEGTIEQVPALAVFLPLVAGLCGSSGNQAMAVSMRELSLGLVQPADYIRVCTKELAVGLALGLGLGVAVFLIAWAKPPDHDYYLAMVVGLAVPLTMMVAVVVGGVVPLLLKRLRVDPAMASGAIVTMVADMSGFLAVLVLASAILPQLT